MPAKLDPETVDRILLLRQQGRTGSEIAREVGCSISTACRVLKGHRPQKQPSQWELLPGEVREEILQANAKGYSTSYLSRQYGIAYKRLLRELPHNPVAGTTGLKKLESVEKELIEEYQKTSVGVREIAKRYGVQERTLQSFLQMRGLLKARGGQTGEHNPQKKEGRTGCDNDRYWARQVVETSLGQKLPTGFVIHHMNEVPGDQTLSNLWLFQCNADHLKYHQWQLVNLQQGGLLVPNQLATRAGGLWLPQILALLASEPDTTVHDLLCKRVTLTQAQRESLQREEAAHVFQVVNLQSG